MARNRFTKVLRDTIELIVKTFGRLPATLGSSDNGLAVYFFINKMLFLVIQFNARKVTRIELVKASNTLFYDTAYNIKGNDRITEIFERLKNRTPSSTIIFSSKQFKTINEAYSYYRDSKEITKLLVKNDFEKYLNVNDLVSAITVFLNIDKKQLSNYQISKGSNISYSKVYRLRTGENDIKNLSLDSASRLIKYASLYLNS